MLILDACIVITFATGGYLSVIEDLRLHSVCIAARAAGEVIREPGHGALQRAIAARRVTLETIDLEIDAEQQALARFDSRPAFRNRGEAEVLALALTRGYIVASDENAVRKSARNELGPSRVVGTIDLLRWAVRENRLSVAAAAQTLSELDSGQRILSVFAQQGLDVREYLRTHGNG